MTSPTPSLCRPVLAHVVRSGFAESVHHGSVVAVDGAGTALSVGDVTGPTFPRSSNKPLQALAMVVPASTSTASCWPSPAPATPASRLHLRRRAPDPRRREAEATLHNIPHLPYDEAERRSWVADGRPASSLARCSGSMCAATCVANGSDLATYRDPATQQRMSETLAEPPASPSPRRASTGAARRSWRSRASGWPWGGLVGARRHRRGPGRLGDHRPSRVARRHAPRLPSLSAGCPEPLPRTARRASTPSACPTAVGSR